MKYLLLLFVVCLFACESSYKEFPGKVEFSGSTFYVINNSDLKFDNVRFTLNDNFKYKGYSIKPHDTAVFTVETFSNSDGLKFDPNTMIVNVLYFACDNGKFKYSMQYSK